MDGRTQPKVTNARVLVVDDSDVNRYMLKQHVTAQKHVVVDARNGVEALEKLRSERFDLVLLDVLMPEMGGREVLEAMRGDPALTDIPVIMVSALDELDSVVHCIELGAADYLTKPFQGALLSARMGACLENKRLWDELRAKTHRVRHLEQMRDEMENRVEQLRTSINMLLVGMDALCQRATSDPKERELWDVGIAEVHSLLRAIESAREE